jgi:acyl carrier protein
MSKGDTNGSVPAFGNFLAYLRQQGFRVGFDHYFRVQELLERIGGDREPDELRTLLCPLFATSEKQQVRFYEAFDSYAELVQAPPPPPPQRDQEKPKKSESKDQTSRSWVYLAGAGLLLAVLLIGFALGLIPRPPFLKEKPQPTPSVTPTPDDTPIQTTTIDSNAKITPGSDNRPLTVTPQPTSIPTVEISPEAKETPVVAPPAPLRFYLLVVSVLLALFMLWELYRFMRRKLFLGRQSARKPPSIWPIRVEAPAARIYDSEDFYRAARLMRRRQVAEYQRLDVNATVAATISALGYPTFRYKPDSKAPEYLVLIDRASFRDHQAQLFNELIRAFEQEGLFVVRYFYEGDPRVCCDDKGENCIHLSELQNQYVGHRLLIFGNGDKLLDPITGRLAAWTSMFLDWQDRAILTPEARWELREFSLATHFIVLPASLDGLMALVDHFDTMVTTDPRIWSPTGFHEPPTDLDEEVSVEALKSYLGDPAFQWLCACAVYPELQWNLTLYLGSLECMHPGTVREQNLLRLIRLPWFRNGSLPDSMRWPLINQLDDKREPEVRGAIIKLLEKSPPPAGTLAADKYDLELAVQHWRLEQDAESLKKLHSMMSRLTPAQIMKDQTLVRYLEREPHPVLDLVLPRRLRKYFFQDGLPVFGLRIAARFVITGLLIVVAMFLIRTNVISVPPFLRQSPSPQPSISPTPAATPTSSAMPTPTVSPSASPTLSPSGSPTDSGSPEPASSPSILASLPSANGSGSSPSPPLSDSEINSKVTQLLVDSLGVDEGKVNPKAKLITDLGADDLDTMEIVMRLEEEFGIKIPDQDAEKFQTVQDVMDYVNKHRTSSAPGPHPIAPRSAARPTSPARDDFFRPQLRPGGITTGRDHSKIRLELSRGHLYTRTFQNRACKIESIEVRMTLDEGRIHDTTFSLRSGEKGALPMNSWSTALTDSCANIARAIGITAPTSSPSPTPTPEELMLNLVGLTEGQARVQLTLTVLRLGNIVYEDPRKADVPSHVVLSQRPLPGTPVKAGATVDLVVSASATNSILVRVPNVVGMSSSRAIKALQAVGLSYEFVEGPRIGQLSSDSRSLFKQARWEYELAPGEKKVFRQDPPAGKKVTPGTRVRLWAAY